MSNQGAPCQTSHRRQELATAPKENGPWKSQSCPRKPTRPRARTKMPLPSTGSRSAPNTLKRPRTCRSRPSFTAEPETLQWTITRGIATEAPHATQSRFPYNPTIITAVNTAVFIYLLTKRLIHTKRASYRGSFKFK